MKVNFHLLVRCCLLQNLPNKTPPPQKKKGNYLKKKQKKQTYLLLKTLADMDLHKFVR